MKTGFVKVNKEKRNKVKQPTSSVSKTDELDERAQIVIDTFKRVSSDDEIKEDDAMILTLFWSVIPHNVKMKTTLEVFKDMPMDIRELYFGKEVEDTTQELAKRVSKEMLELYPKLGKADVKVAEASVMYDLVSSGGTTLLSFIIDDIDEDVFAKTLEKFTRYEQC